MDTRIAIFRAGTHTAMSGLTRDYTPAELYACAEAYDPGRFDAPVVVGHPDTDSPAFGWVKSLSFDGEILWADLGQVDPAFAEAVEAGRYKKVSAAFFLPPARSNPSPGTLYLRHVGFLGGAAPAVQGLPPVSFAAGDYEEVQYSLPEEAACRAESRQTPTQDQETRMSEQDQAAFAEAVQERDALKTEVAALRAENARIQAEAAAREKTARHQEHAAFCAAQVADGRLPSGLAPVMTEALDVLADQADVKFSAADKPLAVAFREALASLPRLADTAEHAAGPARKAMSRAEFEALDPAARMAAVAAGVQLT